MRLSTAGDVHVNAINPLEAVVFQVVFLEGDGHGDTYWEVGEDAKPAVIGGGGEGKVVTQLMNG